MSLAAAPPWSWANHCNSVAERICTDLSPSFTFTPPVLTLNGFVDTQKFTLAENDEIGLDKVTRNSSAIFLTWSKFLELENGSMPAAGWYANYVYAMFPKCKPHLTKNGSPTRTRPLRFDNMAQRLRFAVICMGSATKQQCSVPCRKTPKRTGVCLLC